MENCKGPTMMGKKTTLRVDISFSFPENSRMMFSRECANNDLEDDSIKASVMTKLSTIQHGTDN